MSLTKKIDEFLKEGSPNMNYMGRINGIVKWVNELQKEVSMSMPLDKRDKINKKFNAIAKRVEGLGAYFKEK